MANSLGVSLTRRKRNKLVTILLNGTSEKAILIADPKLAFKFKTNTYTTGGANTTFSSAMTHTAASNATMVDSDGLLKWRPHNNISKSNSFDTWNKTSTTVVANNAVGPNGIANTADTVNFTTTTSNIYNLSTVAVTQGEKITFAAWVRSDTITSLTICLNGRTQTPNNTPFANRDVTPTWTLVTYEASVQASDTGLFFVFGHMQPNNVNTQIGALEMYGAHMYRSDLGGMVNNSDTGDSFVPTTTAAVYGPRVGHHIYNGTAWVNEGILHESEARTNLVTNSGNVSAAGWAGGLKPSSVVSGSPFGTYQEISPVSTSSNMGGAQRYQIGKAIASGSTYVGWALVKSSAGSGWFDVNMYDTSKGNEKAWFDLQNGVVGTKEALIIDHGMVDYGDGWWLCWASAAAASGSGGVSYEVPNGDGLGTCNVGDVILIAGTQFELGSTPSSYISTAGATVTRAADLLTVPTANLPYDSTNVSIQIDGKMTYADTSNINEVQLYFWTLNGSNYIITRLGTTGFRTGQPSFLQRQTTSGNDFVNGHTSTYSPAVNVPFNFASRHGDTFINGSVDGTLLIANTTPTILPDLSATNLRLGFNFMGTIGQFRMWDVDLEDSGIVEVST